MRLALSDFLGDNLPYNYRPHRVKIALLQVGLYSRDNPHSSNFEFIKVVGLVNGSRGMHTWESVFPNEKLETARFNSPISSFTSPDVLFSRDVNQKSIMRWRLKRLILRNDT